MQDFPANSQKAKARPDAPPPTERPKVERVTSATAEQRKRGLGRKFKETFVAGSLRDTAENVVIDTVVPAVRDMVYDAFEASIQSLIYGGSNRPRGRGPAPSSYSGAPRINYQGMSTRPPTTAPPSNRMLSRRSRTRQDFAEIIIESRREADEVIEQMYEFLSRFGVVYLADLYALTGIPSSHVDYKWGWTSLQGSKVTKMRDGRFLLDIPEPEELQ